MANNTSNIEKLITRVKSFKLSSGLDDSEIIDIVKTSLKKEIVIPTSVFCSELGILEATVKFLKEELELSFNRISKLINRDQRTIWTCYSKASMKQPKKFHYNTEELCIPVRIFSNRKYSPLMAISLFLASKGMRTTTIGRILHRDSKNIWAAVRSARNRK